MTSDNVTPSRGPGVTLSRDVTRPKFADERFDDNLRWIEHRIAGTGLQMRLLKAYSNHTLCSKVGSYLPPLGSGGAC